MEAMMTDLTGIFGGDPTASGPSENGESMAVAGGPGGIDNYPIAGDGGRPHGDDAEGDGSSNQEHHGGTGAESDAVGAGDDALLGDGGIGGLEHPDISIA